MNKQLQMAVNELRTLRTRLQINNENYNRSIDTIEELKIYYENNETLNIVDTCFNIIFLLISGISFFSSPYFSLAIFSMLILKEITGIVVDRVLKKDALNTSISLYNRVKNQQNIINTKIRYQEMVESLGIEKERILDDLNSQEQKIEEIQKQTNIQEQNFIPIIDVRYNDKVKVRKLGSYKK